MLVFKIPVLLVFIPFLWVQNWEELNPCQSLIPVFLWQRWPPAAWRDRDRPRSSLRVSTPWLRDFLTPAAQISHIPKHISSAGSSSDDVCGIIEEGTFPAPTRAAPLPSLPWDVPWLKLQNDPRLCKTWELNILNTLQEGLADPRVSLVLGFDALMFFSDFYFFSTISSAAWPDGSKPLDESLGSHSICASF